MSRRTRFPSLSACLIVGGALLLAAPIAEAQYFGRNKVKYKDFDWRIYHSVHFDVHYYPEEEQLLEKVVSFAESAYDELSREFDHQVKDPIPLIYYATHNDFEQTNVILNFIPEGIGAFAVPTRNRMVLPVDMPDPELMQLILHELTHVFQFSMLYEGRAAKGLAASPPQWLIEGMASYYAKDESARDKSYLRDAVVNDRIPSVTRSNVGGFFAYRFGHAVFDYMEERWGADGVRDFLAELRNNLGGQMGRVFERTFQIKPEDLDADFRRWLRKKYLPQLVDMGEPSDYGRVFLRKETIFNGMLASPAPSPSGDLVAMFSTHKGDIDIVLYDSKSRELVRNLTKGLDSDFEYYVAQELTLGRKMGRDLAFSPDGNTIAFFARQGPDRKLVLLDVLKSKISRVIETGVSQPSAPAWSPDGRQVAFGGYRDGRFDIFAADVSSEEVTRITDDELFDGAPTYAPDGRSIVVTTVVAEHGKLFQIELDRPVERKQLTFGDSNETDAVFSPDGKNLYFTSDRNTSDNVYGLELESGTITQYTNSVTSCYQPAVLASPDGRDRLVYSAFWKGRLDVYVLDLDDPITPPTVVEEGAAPELAAVGTESRFQPSIEVAIDEDNQDRYRPFNFILEDLDAYIGVSDDQTVIGQTVISFTDYLGDRRFLINFFGVESFQEFTAVYADLSGRLQWNVRLFDDEAYFIGRNIFQRGPTALKQLGAVASLVYPISPAHRASIGAGYVQREFNFQTTAFRDVSQFTLEEIFALDPSLMGLGLEDLSPADLDAALREIFPIGIQVLVLDPRKDEFPLVEASLVGDTTAFAPWGPIDGRRWRLSASHAQNVSGGGGTLYTNLSLDFRQYQRLTARSNLAVRLWGSFNEGDGSNPVYFGGLDTVRGFDFRSIVGNQGFFSNIELRFPLFDQLSSTFLNFGGVRGILFVDVGGAWFDNESFDFYDEDNGRLADGVASYGYGFTVNFLGLDLNFDFARRTDFESSSKYESSFWIGTRF